VKTKLFVKMQLRPTLSAQTYFRLRRELPGRDPLYSANFNFFASSSCSGLGAGGFSSLPCRARSVVLPHSDHHLGHRAISCSGEAAV